jgi:predicted metal-dependent hydrolase
MYPPMTHLDGFWDSENWADDKWAEYQRRQSGFWARIVEKIDQLGHWFMGKTMTREEWEAREKGQWPSGTGSYDPCADHYSWLCGAGHKEEARTLKEEAQRRRSEFLA